MTSSPAKTPVSKNPLMLALYYTLAMVAVLPLVAWWGQANHGQQGLLAAGIAFGICWMSGLSALLVTSILRGPQMAAAGLLASMIFRLGMPMAGLAMFVVTPHPLGQVGIGGMLVIFHLLTLAVETPLSLMLVRPAPSATGAI